MTPDEGFADLEAVLARSRLAQTVTWIVDALDSAGHGSRLVQRARCHVSAFGRARRADRIRLIAVATLSFAIVCSALLWMTPAPATSAIPAWAPLGIAGLMLIPIARPTAIDIGWRNRRLLTRHTRNA